MRASAKYAPSASALAALLASMVLVAAIPAAPVAAASATASQEHLFASGITNRRARRVIRWNASRNCHEVEGKRTIKVKIHIGGPLLPPVTIHRVVQNGKCLASVVPYGTCDEGTWKAGGSGVDIYMEGQKYIHCQMVIQWRTNKYTWYGLCWAEVGKPRDPNAIITARRFMEVGYDKRGALRTHVDDWGCRVS